MVTISNQWLHWRVAGGLGGRPRKSPHLLFSGTVNIDEDGDENMWLLLHNAQWMTMIVQGAPRGPILIFHMCLVDMVLYTVIDVISSQSPKHV